MPKGSAKLTNSRREEIISACRKLYQTMSYREITIKEIAEETSFTRPSIYNYFETKEEIFLALFRRNMRLSAKNWISFASRRTPSPRMNWPPRLRMPWRTGRCCSSS